MACEVFQRRKVWVLSFLWQLADALGDARCCRLGHTQLLPSADMEKGSGYMGQGGRQVSRGQSARQAGRKVAGWLWGYSCLLSSVASGGVAHWVPPCPLLVDGCRDLTN